jgi:hypothetical protein
MKLQFSLATLLVCMTVLAVVCTLAMNIQIHEQRTAMWWSGSIMRSPPSDWEVSRSPNTGEIIWRLAWAAPLSLVATLGVLWAIRRLKSRRENGPRGG